MQQQKDSWQYILQKYSTEDIFKNLMPKESFTPLGHIFNKVNRGIVQKSDEVGT